MGTHSLEKAERGTKSGYGKKPTDRGALTSWRPHREGQVRTWKETDRAMRTHVLETTQGGTSQDTERNRPSDAHSRSGDHTGRGKSGHGKKPTERCALTLWRPRREGQVRTRKETNRAMRTHQLETAQGGTSQDTERNRPSDAHSPTGDSTGGDKSGHGKKPTERCALTFWRPHREGQVRSRKETDRAMRTHTLETAQGGTSQDTERNRPSNAHSPTGDHTGRDKSGHGKKSTERRALTLWRPHRERQVRTRKETDRAMRTHFLEIAQGETSQETERN